MGKCRNWQTTLTQNQRLHSVGVQVPFCPPGGKVMYKVYLGNSFPEDAKLLYSSSNREEINKFMVEYVQKNFPDLGYYWRYWEEEKKNIVIFDFGSHITFFFVQIIK